MASKVVIVPRAQEDFLSLPKIVQSRIAVAMRALSEFPIIRTGIKKLKPPFDGYRKRVGDYRILFDFSEDTVYIHRIIDRKDAYG